MFKVCTHYLNDAYEPEVHERDFADYNEAMTDYAYEIVANDSNAMGMKVLGMGYDYIAVSLWKVDEGNERLAYWTKAFF